MKSLKLTLPLLLILFSFTQVFSQVSQDTIYKKSGKILVAKVTEVLPDVVKYIYPNGKDSIIMGIDRDELQKIAFANGAVQLFVDAMINPEHYADQHKSDIKIDFIAPMLNHFSIAYEKSIKPGMSWESGISIVGVGYRPEGYNPASGGIVGGGIKFIHTPDFTSGNQHYTHILKGGYVRLQAYAGYYTETTTSYNYNNGSFSNPGTISVNNKYTVGGIHVQFGKQYVFDDIFLLDIYAGIGYAIVSYSNNNPNNSVYNNSDNNGDSYDYVYTRFSSSSPISISGGLRIGILF